MPCVAVREGVAHADTGSLYTLSSYFRLSTFDS